RSEAGVCRGDARGAREILGTGTRRASDRRPPQGGPRGRRGSESAIGVSGAVLEPRRGNSRPLVELARRNRSLHRRHEWDQSREKPAEEEHQRNSESKTTGSQNLTA